MARSVQKISLARLPKSYRKLLLEYYFQIRFIHIVAICLSGGLFLLRALCSINGAQWPHTKFARILSATIDSFLLAAAIILWLILPKEIFANNWLNAKLVLVVVYIAIGFVAMRQTNAKPVRIAAILAAVLTFAAIVTIARAHAIPFIN